MDTMNKPAWCACLVTLMSVLLSHPAEATHMVRTAGCSGSKGCHATISLPDGTTATVDLAGFGVGDTFVDVAPDAEQFTWRTTDMNGVSPVFGRLAVSLNPSMVSTGLVTSLDPTATPAFPASQTNFFFFLFSMPDLGLTMFNKEPFTLFDPEIDDVPPDCAIYPLLQPVDFFDTRVPFGNPIFTITQAEVTFNCVPEPATLTLVGLGSVGIGLRRRRSRGHDRSSRGVPTSGVVRHDASRRQVSLL